MRSCVHQAAKAIRRRPAPANIAVSTLWSGQKWLGGWYTACE
jgi:hypothetical protein